MKKGLTGFQLKMIALAGMLFDHINSYFGTALGFPLWFNWVGRFVAPVFLYLLVEGYQHTRNRRAYFYRLLSVSLVMWLINLVHNLLTKQYLHPMTKEFDLFGLLAGHNIFHTLILFFILFVLLDRFRDNSGLAKYLNLLWLVFLLPFIIFSEGGLQLLPLAVVFHWFKNQKPYVVGILLVTSLFWLAKAIMAYLSYGHAYQSLYQQLTFDNQFMQILALPLILAYNGQRGGKGYAWESKLFYIIYPAHLGLIYLIKMLVG